MCGWCGDAIRGAGCHRRKKVEKSACNPKRLGYSAHVPGMVPGARKQTDQTQVAKVREKENERH